LHEWSRELWKDIEAPLLTCEAVISEASFLLMRTRGGVRGVFELLRRGIITISFDLQEEIGPVDSMLEKYSDVPMSVADACLVRMSEQFPESSLFTVDSDFRRYRRHSRQVIPLIIST
jgi:predicted nucleic acid-binding protein